ncbi:MAG: hypothetical protein LBP71_00775, partial [Spirochaetaceae bacterium]|nr:hypothetical protein [Spirochaetaceae bacterium]
MGNRTVQSREPPRGVTFEDVWAAIQETDRQLKEMSAETDRQLKEMGAETDRRMQEAAREVKETARFVKEMGTKTDRRLGELGNSLGDVIEHLMSPKLHEKFKALGFTFSYSIRNIKFKDHKRNQLAEVDVFLENGEYAMAVEVKTRLRIEDVKDHLKRMAILRRAADERNDKRKYLG